MIERLKAIDYDKLWIGLLLGIIMPCIGMSLYYFINYSGMPVRKFIQLQQMGGTYTALISLSVLANLAAFYPFIWKEKWNGAKGVILATFLWAALVVVFKFTL